MKKLFFFILLLCATSVYAQDFQSGDLFYYVESWEEKTVRVAGHESYKSFTEVTIPSTIEYAGETYTVTKIGNYAFNDCQSLTSITMPNTVTEIDYGAFTLCENLSSITLSNTLKKIHDYAFESCNSLTNITLPNTVVEIGNGAFRWSKNLQSINIPEGVSIINYDTFSDCQSLTTITLPNSLTEIGNHAFHQCYSLESIVLPANLTKIDYNAFTRARSLKSINLPSTLEYIGNSAFYECQSLTTINIPVGITKINTETFYDCDALKSVIIPNGVTQIGYGAFQSCGSLTSITIPNSVKTIEGWAFQNCSSLASMSISTSVKEVHDYAFNECNSFETITIHANSINELCEGVITQLISQHGVGDYAARHFYVNGVELSGHVVIPEGTTKINTKAFYNESKNSNKISSVEIPTTVASIGEYALYGIPMVHINATTPPAITSTNIIDENAFIVLPDAATLATYQSTPIWEEFGTRLVTKDAMQLREVTVAANNSLSSLHKTIGEENLMNTIRLKVRGTINSYDIMLIRNKMLNLRYLDLSDAEVKACPYEYYSGFCTHDNKLEDHSFSELNLQVVHLPKNLEEIYECFLSCPHLDTVYCQPGLKRIGTSAFNNCPSLRYVGVHEGLKEIGDYAFYSTPNLHTVNFPSTLESIGYYAFHSSGINAVTIPANVSYIGSEAFRGCKMESLVFEPGGKLNTISSEIFSDLSKLKTIDWENSNITHIEYRGMANCPQLKITAFPRNLRHIDYYAFENCSSIDSIVLPARLEEIGAHAFQYCHNVKVIKIPSTVRQIHDNAFYGCSNVTSVYTHTIEPTKINQQTFSCYKTATLFVPKTSYYNYYYNTQWSQFIKLKEYEEEYNYFYLYGDYYLGGEYGNITGNPDGDLFPGSGLITVGNDKVDVHNIHYYAGPDHFTGEWNYPSLITDNNLSIDTLFIHLSQRMYEWSFMTFPYDIDRAVLECNSEFVVRYYDGQIRANNGEGGWQNVPVGQQMLNGKGYIFQSANGDTLTMTFPKPNLPNKDIAVPLYQYNSINPWDANWNMVGNPFLAYFDMNALTGFTYPVVAWNGYGYDTYRPGDDEYHFKPLESFFIQNVDLTKINFPIDGRETLTQAKSKLFSAPARRNTDGPTTRFIVNINLSDSTYTDRTRVVFNNQASVDYEMGVDASKMISTTAPVQLYTIGKSNEQYSINERPATIDGEMIQLGYYAAYAGEFTLSASRMDTTIMIYDNVEKQYVDLSLGEYTFNTEAGFNNSRFAMCATEKQDTPSSIQDVNMENLSSVSVYTTTGQTIAENVDFSTLHLPAGVYMIKSNNTIFKIVLP